MVTASDLLGALNTDAAEVLDVLAAASLVLDSKNQVIRATPGAISFGLVQNQELIHKQLVQIVDKARTTNSTVVEEVSLQTGLRGEKSFVHVRAAKLSKGFVLLMVEDRTEIRRLEDTRRDFVENISHELKTPIGAISLLTEAIQDSTDDPELVKKFATTMQREIDRLSELVKDIIQLSQLQSAESPITHQLVDFGEVVAQAIEANQIGADKRRIKLNGSIPAGIQVFGDRKALTAAVKNLIENAVIYSEDGGQVGIGLREVDGIAELSVLDNGIGIPIAEQDRIFERFYRVDPSRSRETGGTGLGLAIVKHVAHNHRGEIKVFSQPGLGSTFTLRIPIADLAALENEGSN